MNNKFSRLKKLTRDQLENFYEQQLNENDELKKSLKENELKLKKVIENAELQIKLDKVEVENLILKKEILLNKNLLSLQKTGKLDKNIKITPTPSQKIPKTDQVTALECTIADLDKKYQQSIEKISSLEKELAGKSDQNYDQELNLELFKAQKYLASKEKDLEELSRKIQALEDENQSLRALANGAPSGIGDGEISTRLEQDLRQARKEIEILIGQGADYKFPGQPVNLDELCKVFGFTAQEFEQAIIKIRENSFDNALKSASEGLEGERVPEDVKRIQQLEKAYTLSNSELEKTRDILASQYKVNQDLRLSLDEARLKLENLSINYDERVAELTDKLKTKDVRICELQDHIDYLKKLTSIKNYMRNDLEYNMEKLRNMDLNDISDGSAIIKFKFNRILLNEEYKEQIRNNFSSFFFIMDFVDFGQVKSQEYSLEDSVDRNEVAINDLLIFPVIMNERILRKLLREISRLNMFGKMGESTIPIAYADVDVGNLLVKALDRDYTSYDLVELIYERNLEHVGIPMMMRIGKLDVEFSLKAAMPSSFFSDSLLDDSLSKRKLEENKIILTVEKCLNLPATTSRRHVPSLFFAGQFMKSPVYISSLVNETLDPVFNENCSFDVPSVITRQQLLEESIEIHIIDKSLADSESFIGYANIPLADFMEDHTNKIKAYPIKTKLPSADCFIHVNLSFTGQLFQKPKPLKRESTFSAIRSSVKESSNKTKSRDPVPEIAKNRDLDNSLQEIPSEMSEIKSENVSIASMKEPSEHDSVRLDSLKNSTDLQASIAREDDSQIDEASDMKELIVSEPFELIIRDINIDYNMYKRVIRNRTDFSLENKQKIFIEFDDIVTGDLLETKPIYLIRDSSRNLLIGDFEFHKKFIFNHGDGPVNQPNLTRSDGKIKLQFILEPNEAVDDDENYECFEFGTCEINLESVPVDGEVPICLELDSSHVIGTIKVITKNTNELLTLIKKGV